MLNTNKLYLCALQASKDGSLALRFAAKRESQHIGDFKYFNSPLISHKFVEVDLNAQALMRRYGLSDLGVPALVSGINTLF